MSYKGSNWTRGELGNVPDKNPAIECADENCDNTTRAQDADGWLLHNDPQIPVLCPACQERVPNNKQTPTEHQRETNKQLTEYA